jgi:hypothetical protein
MKLSHIHFAVLAAALASLGIDCKSQTAGTGAPASGGSGGSGAGNGSSGGTGGTQDPGPIGGGGSIPPEDFFTTGEFEKLEDVSAYFVGHSLMSDIPDIVTHITNEMRPGSMSFREQDVAGAPLRWHWEETGPGGADPIETGDFTHQIHEALASGLYSHLVVTDSVPRGGTEMEDESVRYFGEIVAAARQARADVRIFYYETWHHITSGLPGHDPYNEDTASPTRNLLWRERIDADAAMWERIVDRVNQERPPGPTGHRVQLIPAGRVLASAIDAMGDRTIEGFDNIHDVFQDEIHTNHYGKFIVAAIQAATLSRRDPRDFDVDIVTRWGGQFWGEPTWDGFVYERPSDAVAAAFLQLVYERLPVHYRDR